MTEKVKTKDVQSQPQGQSEQPEIQINVEPAVAMNLTVQEFDKRIAEAEANVADLKKQKAAFIYDTNVQALIKQAQQNKIRMSRKQNKNKDEQKAK